MRRLAAAAAVLLLASTGCSRLAQQQDTLAPRVAPPDAPSQAAPSGAPSDSLATAPSGTVTVSCGAPSVSSDCQVVATQAMPPSATFSSTNSATAAQAS